MEYVRTEVITDKYTDEENSEALSELQGSILWSKRSILYRISFLALLPLFAAFLLGFSSPFWMKKHQVDKYRGYYNIREKVDVSIGLWRVCEGTGFSDITDCTVIPDITHYIVVCQSMLCLCLIFTVFSLIFGIYENCATRYDFDEGSDVRSKRPEMNAVLAGMFGLIGVIMYGTSIISAVSNGEGAMHWAFVVTTGSVIGEIVCGIIMAIVNPIHSATQNFSGQIISLSRQNSLKAREPTFQDRLVTSGDSVVQAIGVQGSGTTYGVTGSNFDINEVKFIQRSESSFSSLTSSPEVCNVTFQAPGLSRVPKSTYVVETQDIHPRSRGDSSRMQEIKKQKIATQSESEHSDCRHQTGIIKVQTLPDVIFSPENGSHCENKDIQPSMSLLKDKVTSGVNSNAPSFSLELKSRPGESDLMIHDDLVFKTPAKNEQKLDSSSGGEDIFVSKSAVTSCIEETPIAPPQMLYDLQRSTISSGSWENQPWPDPPTESEMLEETVLGVSINNNPYSDGSISKHAELQCKGMPDGVLPQTQSLTAHFKKHSQGEESNISYRTLKSCDTHIKSSRAIQSKESRKVNGKKSSSINKSQVPVRQEYDNPLFRSKPLEGEQSTNEGECFSYKDYDTPVVFPHISVQPSPATNYSVLGTTENDLIPQRIHSKHDTKSDLEKRPKHTTHLSNGQSSEIPPPAYNRFGKKIQEDKSKKSSGFLESSKSSNAQQQHQNGDVKLHSRKVKREQQQKQSAHLHSDLEHKQQTSSAQEGRIDSGPHLTSKLPKLELHKSGNTDTGNRPSYSQRCNNGGRKPKTAELQMPRGSDVSGKQYKIQADHYGTCLDSDI